MVFTVKAILLSTHRSVKVLAGSPRVYGSCSVHQLTFVKYFGLDQLFFLLAHFAAIFCIKTREALLYKSAKTLTRKQAQPPYGNETDYITKHLKSRSTISHYHLLLLLNCITVI